MRHIITFALFLLLLIGCGPKRPSSTVKGTITYKSQPVNNASLQFYASGKTEPSFTVPVSKEGTFSAVDVVPGDYKIVVEGHSGSEGIPDTSRMDPAKAAEMKAKFEKMRTEPTIPFPAKYKSIQTTDLSLNVTKDQKPVTLELKD